MINMTDGLFKLRSIMLYFPSCMHRSKPESSLVNTIMLLNIFDRCV